MDKIIFKSQLKRTYQEKTGRQISGSRINEFLSELYKICPSAFITDIKDGIPTVGIHIVSVVQSFDSREMNVVKFPSLYAFFKTLV